MATRLSCFTLLAACLILLFGLASGNPVATFLTLDDPTVGQGTVFLHVDRTPRTDLAVVNCSVPVGSTCSCSLLETNPANGPFDVYKFTGDQEFKVYFVGKTSAYNSLDSSTNGNHFVTVLCTETDISGNQPTDQAILHIRLMPNLSPVFAKPSDTSITYNAQRNLPKGTFLHKVSVTDPEGDSVTFTMTQDPDLGYLNIGKTNGEITSAVLLETVTSADIICTVTVSDGRNQAEGFVTIKLENLNGRPDILNLPATINVTEDRTTGFTLATLTFRDTTPYQNLEPECSVDPVAENYKFTYEVGTRKLKLNTINTGETLLDFETTDKYLISCYVTDGFLTSTGEILTMYVNNVNEPPVFSQTVYHCTLPESKDGVSKCDLGLTVTDPELNTIRTLEILDSTDFRYDAATNTLTFNGDYDVDNNKPTSALVTIYAVDSNGATGTAKIQIIIEDVNDNVCNFGSQQAAQFTVDQGTNLHTLGSFVVTDGDMSAPNNEVEFEVIAGFPVNSLNYLTVFGTGEIKYAGLIPETAHGQSFSITVRCKDRGSPSLSATGTVQVSFLTTTTTTTTTPATPTITRTTTSTTTTQPPDDDLFDNTGFVVLFVILMLLLVIGLLVALWYFCCRNYAAACLPRRYNDGPPPRHVRPAPNRDDYYRRGPSRVSPDYRDQSWRNGDHFEDGLGYYGTPVSNGDVFLTHPYRSRALPAPVPRGGGY